VNTVTIGVSSMKDLKQRTTAAFRGKLLLNRDCPWHNVDVANRGAVSDLLYRWPFAAVFGGRRDFSTAMQLAHRTFEVRDVRDEHDGNDDDHQY
jgi:hypothetical protein